MLGVDSEDLFNLKRNLVRYLQRSLQREVYKVSNTSLRDSLLAYAMVGQAVTAKSSYFHVH